MSATTIAGPAIAGRALTRATRVVFLALAIIALVAVSFVLGRHTVNTAKQNPAITPAARVQTTTFLCRTGRAC